MNDYTILYYTSCREDESFEKKIKDKLLSVCGDIPIVSVSQKPIDFGTNVCVGDVGTSDHNLFRQIWIGCKAAKTPYVISCEADCLYPPDYFQFVPDGKQCYRFKPSYVLEAWGKDGYGGFFPKGTAPFAQIAKRDWYINEIEKAMIGRPYWSPDDRNRVMIFMQQDWETRELKNPIITLKTGKGMRKHTQVNGPCVFELPYWGESENLRRKIWG
jgi:hypothetical protein